MIKATELRIGNLFMTEYNETFVVGGVMDCDVESEDGKNDWHKVEYVQATNGDNFGFEQVYGIPLTEDWLIRFGFVKERNHIDTHDLYLFNRFSLYRIDSELWDVAKGSNYFKMAEIKYVHHIQNLFFALTGEELTIK